MREDSVSRSCKASPVYFCLNYMFCIWGEWMKIEAVSKWTRERVSRQSDPFGAFTELRKYKTRCRRFWRCLSAREKYLRAHAMLSYAKSLQSCLTLCDPIDGSPPGSPVPGILQARTLEWVAISFSNAWKWKVKVKLLSRVWHKHCQFTALARPTLCFIMLTASRNTFQKAPPLGKNRFF